MKDIEKVYYNSVAAEKKLNPRWWNIDEKEQYQHLFPLVRAIEQGQNYRKLSNIKNARLYSNLEVLGMVGSMFSKTANDAVIPSRITLNVVKSCTDTVSSKIASAKPRPLFLTEDGDWKLQKRARNLTKFIDGSFDAMKLYPISAKCFVDSCVFGTGLVKFYPDKDKKMICAERIIPDEIVIDDNDGMYGFPRQMHQRKFVNKDVLMDAFPDFEKEIREASGIKPGELNSDATPDIVCVIESWHLPSSGSAKDGRKVICINNATLDSREWSKDYFPFGIQRWSERLTGWYGMGLADELFTIQLEINKILRNIQAAQHLMAVPRIWVENNSMVNTQHINNQIGAIGKYTGTAPIFQVAPAMSPEVYQHLENLYRKAYEITGVSMLSATSRKPDGLDSGVALREYQDIESERFKQTGQRYEDYFLECAKIVIDQTKDLAKEIGDVEVKLGSGKYAETLKWSEVNLDEDKYVMRVFPTSILPTTPAGKLQTVQDLTQAGFIDKDTAMDLLDFPDTDAAISRKLAPTRIISKLIEKMIDEGEYIPPEPYMNLQLALEFTQESYLQAKMQGVPEERLELLRTFMTDCQTLMGIGAPPPPMPAQGQPTAVPQAPPQSDLLPNVPQAI